MGQSGHQRIDIFARLATRNGAWGQKTLGLTEMMCKIRWWGGAGGKEQTEWVGMFNMITDDFGTTALNFFLEVQSSAN